LSHDTKDKFPNYSKNIFSSLDTNKIDIVLIDGRFRVACLLSVILNTPSAKGVFILFHDFWNREKYHTVLKHVIEIERVDTLGVFKIKNKIDLNIVQQDYEIYKYIPD
jgi:protein O-GlcNAc transferase